MKYRVEFVTNSSSSNYVVAYRPAESGTNKNLSLEVIQIILDSDGSYDTQAAEYFNTKEELDKYIMDRYKSICDTLEEAIEISELEYLYSTAIEYLRQGYTIATKDIGYGDRAMEKIIFKLAENNDDFIIIGGSEIWNIEWDS